MKITPSNLLQVTLLCFVLFLNFSCNKDSDLLAEYVVEENTMGTEPNEVILDLANAVFTTEEDQAVSFNMLYNTSSNSKGRRRYKRSSKPKYGTITIEKDSVAVYTPSNDYNGKDEIEITLEVINADETTSDVTVTVDVTVEPVADVVVDSIVAPLDEPIVIEPLKNDTFNEESVVTITEVSQPSNGTAKINEDNTITYTPDPNKTGTVEFDYTTSIPTTDDSVDTESGKIIITDNRQEIKEISADVISWQKKFDSEWIRSKSYYESQTSGFEQNGQRRYYDMRVIDGLIAMFQATGETKYLDDFFWYVDRIIKIASLSSDGYYDWPVGGTNYQLYDGHGLRNVHKMLWILKKFPEIRAQSYGNGTYQDKYDEYLPWFTTNLWDKWVSRGNGMILRSNTHMSSHLTNVALYLYLIEDDSKKKDSYLSWINAFNGDVDSKVNRGGSAGTGFRDQLRNVNGKYIWNGNWGNSSGSNDITHTNAESQALVNMYLQGIEYTSADMSALLKTLNGILDDSANGTYSDIPFNLDLSGSRSGVRTLAYGWCMLGRFDETTQQRLENFNISTNQASYYHNMFLGNMAYNRAYLDKSLIYPEF